FFIAHAPSRGPGTRNTKAHCQPASSLIGGTSRMLTIVNRNPALVCSVSAVPTWVRGVYSVTRAENCAESATTVKPQMTAKMRRTASGAPKKSGDARAHAALASIAAPAIRALPQRSARNPAATHPIEPLAIVTNATADPAVPVAAPSD